MAAIYRGKPVGSVAIGAAYGMQHRQVLKYLWMAKDAGRVTPVMSSAGGIVRGWVPADVEVKYTIAEQRAIEAAEAVKRLYAGQPVAIRFIAKQLGRPSGTIARWLHAAERMKLIRKPASGFGWLPA